MLKINNTNIRKRCEICSKLTIKTPKRRPFFSVSIVGFEQVNVCWDIRIKEMCTNTWGGKNIGFFASIMYLAGAKRNELKTNQSFTWDCSWVNFSESLTKMCSRCVLTFRILLKPI